jgi:hypothetical protein
MTVMLVKNNNDTLNDKSKPFLNTKRKVQFIALQWVLVPRSKHFTDEERQRSDYLVNDLLSQQSIASKKKLSVFLNVIDLISFVCHGKTFQKLQSEHQRRILNIFFNSPISLLRKGFWGLNTLARLGVYGQKELHDEIGYKPRSYPVNEDLKLKTEVASEQPR